MVDYEKSVLEHLARPGYEALTPKKLAKAMAVPEEEYRDFRDAVKRLVRSGKLSVGRGNTMMLSGPNAAPEAGLVVGTFRRTSRGFGFVRPRGTADRSKDIYIPEKGTRDASTGDEVAVRIVRKAHGPGTNPEGRIARVVNRASGLFVGTYFEEMGVGFVRVDGTKFAEPIYVGDPGAKGARPGDKVAFEMARYPTPSDQGEGVITELIGPRGQPGVDTLSVIRALNIPDKFEDDTLLEAREVAKEFDEKDVGGRLDLRDPLTVTIDPANARDFDDAITLTRDERGFWSLGVHIADVSHFVRPGGALDRAARQRGNSVYLPDRVIPMLPEILSNSLASLQQGHTRYTMSALMEFDSDGVRTDRQFARSAIRVDHRFTYEQAFEVMMNPDKPHEGVGPELVAMLGRMLELARILRKRRFARGALELNMPEVAVDLGENGEVVGAHLVEDDESHQVIEEFMLAANEAVASHLTARHAGFLRRGHADPDPHKLRQFAEFARSLGIQIDQPQSRFELQRVLRETADRPEVRAIHYGLLRSLKQATYTAEVEGHFALASDDYCHFTSPIRRYPDLQVHRQVNALLEGKKPRSDADELASLAEHCTRTERRAELAEREITRIKLLTHLQTRIGEAFHAVITGVEDFGLFCQLIELPVEGLLHVTGLADDFYQHDTDTHTLVGRRSGREHRLGDRIEVRVARVDVDRRELDLVPADAAPKEAPEDRPIRPRPASPGSGRPDRGREGATSRRPPRPAKSKPKASRPSGPRSARKRRSGNRPPASALAVAKGGWGPVFRLGEDFPFRRQLQQQGRIRGVVGQDQEPAPAFDARAQQALGPAGVGLMDIQGRPAGGALGFEGADGSERLPRSAERELHLHDEHRRVREVAGGRTGNGARMRPLPA
ncbi:MAG: ribonuclease R [Isosphaeraceae bacterium]